MIVKTINCILGLGVILFIATAPVMPRHRSADETFQRVAIELGINTPAATERPQASGPARNAVAASDAADDEEDFSDGCLIEYPEFEAF